MGAVSTHFGGEIARGKHLFPFRTEPLSLSAPMVLGGQPPGRVGRRRSYLSRPSGRLFSLGFGCDAATRFRGLARRADWPGTRPRRKGHNVIGAIILGIIAGYLA